MAKKTKQTKKTKKTTRAAKKIVKRTPRKATRRRAPEGMATRRGAAAAPPAARRGGVAEMAGVAAPVAAVGQCIDLITAGRLVQDAIPGGPHAPDTTLQDAGLITAGQRTVFREDVAQGVRDLGCSINRDDIPNSSTTTLRQVRAAVRDNAG